MNLQQRCQAVFKAGYNFGTTSFRALAAATQLSKSSVHRLYQRIQRRNQYPESPFETNLQITRCDRQYQEVDQPNSGIGNRGRPLVVLG